MLNSATKVFQEVRYSAFSKAWRNSRTASLQAAQTVRLAIDSIAVHPSPGWLMICPLPAFTPPARCRAFISNGFFCRCNVILYKKVLPLSFEEVSYDREHHDFWERRLTAYRKGQVGLRQQCTVLRCQIRPCEARGDAEVFERCAESARDRGKGQGDDRLRRRDVRRVMPGRLPDQEKIGISECAAQSACRKK